MNAILVNYNTGRKVTEYNQFSRELIYCASAGDLDRQAKPRHASVSSAILREINNSIIRKYDDDGNWVGAELLIDDFALYTDAAIGYGILRFKDLNSNIKEEQQVLSRYCTGNEERISITRGSRITWCKNHTYLQMNIRGYQIALHHILGCMLNRSFYDWYMEDTRHVINHTCICDGRYHASPEIVSSVTPLYIEFLTMSMNSAHARLVRNRDLLGHCISMCEVTEEAIKSGCDVESLRSVLSNRLI